MAQDLRAKGARLSNLPMCYIPRLLDLVAPALPSVTMCAAASSHTGTHSAQQPIEGQEVSSMESLPPNPPYPSHCPPSLNTSPPYTHYTLGVIKAFPRTLPSSKSTVLARGEHTGQNLGRELVTRSPGASLPVLEQFHLPVTDQSLLPAQGLPPQPPLISSPLSHPGSPPAVAPLPV